MRTYYTINDYIKQVKALQELGQLLINAQYEDEDMDEVADWVDELENMDLHLECCLSILEENI